MANKTRSLSISTRMLPGPSDDDSKRSLAYQQLRRLLILQQIVPGSRLIETEWALRLRVNRSALREALVRLEVEGLIVKGPSTGYSAPEITMHDIQEILIVRFALESSAIEIVCREGLNTPEHLIRMKQACDALEQFCREEYHLSEVEADWRFHEALVEASQNRRLAIAYNHAPLPILHPDITWGTQWAERVRLTISEHRAILDAILGDHVARAQTLLREHLTAYWEDRDSKPRGAAAKSASDG